MTNALCFLNAAGDEPLDQGHVLYPRSLCESKLPGYTLASGGRLPNKALLKRRAQGEGSGGEMLPVMEAVEASEPWEASFHHSQLPLGA